MFALLAALLCLDLPRLSDTVGLRGAAPPPPSPLAVRGPAVPRGGAAESFATAAAAVARAGLGPGAADGALRDAARARLAETASADAGASGAGGSLAVDLSPPFAAGGANASAGVASADSRGNAAAAAAEGRQQQDDQGGLLGSAVGERLQRVGRLMDRDGDARLSLEEMKQFAQALRDRQRRNQTSEALLRLDADASGGVDMAELGIRSLGAGGAGGGGPAREHQERRFRAADRDGDGSLSASELLAFAHPEVDDRVFAVEREHQLRLFDADGSGTVDFKEFSREAKRQSEEDFDEAAAWEDFRLHDADRDGALGAEELGELLRGHELLEDHIRKTLDVADRDGDGHLHLDDELPGSLQHLLESEFVEDYFLHEHAESSHHGHDEL